MNLTWYTLQRHIGAHDSLGVGEKEALIRDLLKRYTAGLELGDDVIRFLFCKTLRLGQDLLPSVLQYADNYLLLAVYTMLDLADATG